MQWYLKALSRYAQFQGRSQRKEYWYFLLGNLLVAVGLGFVGGLLGLEASELNGLATLYLIAVVVPGLAVSIRRLHDTGRRGWWMLLAFIPLIGTIVLLFFMAQAGEPGPNRFGDDPTQEAVVATVKPALS